MRILGKPQDRLKNPIGHALVRRIAHFIDAGLPFHVYMVLPVHPEGTLNTLNIMTQVHLTMHSLVFGEHSLVNGIRRAILAARYRKKKKVSPKEARKAVEAMPLNEVIKAVRDDWMEYLTLLNLRNWDTIGGKPVTEQIYVHSKLLIVDDRVAILAMSAPAGIAIATPNSATLVTGTNFDQVALRDTNQTTGRRWIHNAAESISLFVSGSSDKIKETLKLIAAKGKIQMQAQSGEIEFTADQAMKITSVKADVTTAAAKDITMTSGGGYVKLGGGDINLHAPGTISIKCAKLLIEGPVSLSQVMPVFPQSEWALEPIKFGLKLQDIPGTRGAVPAGQAWKIVEVDAAAAPDDSGAINPAIFGKDHWLAELFEGSVGADGSLGLDKTQQQSLYQLVSQRPGSIWVISGLTAMPLNITNWSTQSDQHNPKRVVDALNFATDGRGLNDIHEDYLKELAKTDGNVKAINPLQKKIDL